MYIVTIAARISQSSLASEPRNAAAAPWKLICALAGSPSSCCTFWISSTALPSDAPGARLNEIVAAGNWPICVMSSDVACSLMRAIDVNGTCCGGCELELPLELGPAPGAGSAAEALAPTEAGADETLPAGT